MDPADIQQVPGQTFGAGTTLSFWIQPSKGMQNSLRKQWREISDLIRLNRPGIVPKTLQHREISPYSNNGETRNRKNRLHNVILSCYDSLWTNYYAFGVNGSDQSAQFGLETFPVDFQGFFVPNSLIQVTIKLIF